MSTFDTVLREIEHAPESLLRQVLAFERHLKERPIPDQFDAAAASEETLAKDWNLPDEDEAWRGLRFATRAPTWW